MAKKATKKVVIYARCSTVHDQNPEVQIKQLREYCGARGWEVTKEIMDHGYSGSSEKRPGLNEVLFLVRSKVVDVVCVVKLDRLFRSLKHLVTTLHEFEELRCEFVSISDNLDMTTAAGRLHFQILGAFGEFEKNLIRERTLAGLAYAVSKGKVLGRPKLNLDKEIVKLRSEGRTYREIEKVLRCSSTVVKRAIRAEISKQLNGGPIEDNKNKKSPLITGLKNDEN